MARLRTIIASRGGARALWFLSLILVAVSLVVAEFPASNSVTPTAGKKLLRRDTAEAIRQARAAAKSLREVAGIPGLAVAVSSGDEILWSEGFGFANLQQKEPATPRTLFRLGSVSKILTAAAVAKLSQGGKLDLDAPVHEYVPVFPEKGEVITARQLAGHLGGIRSYMDKDFAAGQHIDQRHFATTEEALTIFSGDPLVSSPGTRYRYSVFGYTLLSAVIEGVAGEDFISAMTRLVFGPLGMSHTLPDRKGVKVSNRAEFYVRNGQGEIEVASGIDPSYKWAGGGMLSTVQDLARFGMAHTRPGFFRQETLDTIFRSQRTAAGRETGVGIGWRIATDAWGRRVVHHAGNIAGGRAVLVVYPDTGLSVALLTNLSLAPLAAEASAQLIAEPLLRVRETGRGVVETNLVGKYDYTYERNGKQEDGTIYITPELRWMTTPSAVSSYGARFRIAVPERLPIVRMTVEGPEALIVASSPVGLIALKLEFVGEDSFTGTVVALNATSLKGEITGRRVN